jgi:hypothetical protein
VKIIRPDPDDTSPEIVALNVGDEVSTVRELLPWIKVSFADKQNRQYNGWIPADKLNAIHAQPVRLFNEPEGQPEDVCGEIIGIRLQLPPWQKIDVRLADGTAKSGWIIVTSVAAGNAGSPDDPSPSSAGDLSLGPNEIYRAHLLEAERRTGIGAAALAALINAEAVKLPNGQWNKDSTASTSTASGLTQFLEATWLAEAVKLRTLLNERARAKGCIDQSNAIIPGKKDDLLTLRFDPELSIITAAEFGISNLRGLMDAGLVDEEIGDDDKARFIYICHHEGLAGAKAFLRGSKSYTFSDLVTQVGQIKAQGYVDAAGGNTTAAYRSWFDEYIDARIQPSKFRKAPAVGLTSGGEGTKALSQFDGMPIIISEMSKNVALAKAVQWRLSELGYLDPPADGMFGSVSTWALSEFCERNGLSLQNGLTKTIAQTLLAPKALLPEIALSDTWFDKVISYMQKKNYFICRHPSCKNIVYLEGVSQAGTLNDDARNEFNDLRIVFTIDDQGRPDFENWIWDGTTEPGNAWTIRPMNPKGAARIAFNQYKAWAVGTHHPGSLLGHEALVQVEAISVYRDLNKDFKRTGDKLDTGLFAINQHWGYDAPKDDLGRTSAGCLVGRTKDGHRKFMTHIKRDPRYDASRSYRFVTTIMPGDEVLV